MTIAIPRIRINSFSPCRLGSSQPTLSRLENAVDARALQAVLRGGEEQYVRSN